MKTTAAPAAAAYGFACPPKKTLMMKKKKKKSVSPEDRKKGKGISKGKEKKMSKGKKMGKGLEPTGNENRWPSLYLVIRHAVKCPAYSLYKVNLTPQTGEYPVPSPCRIKYLDAEHDMSFAAVSSEQRSWIVGVGGFLEDEDEDEDRPHGGRAQTIVFDCKAETVAKGPRPTASKCSPIVIAVGEKVYALERMPSILPEHNLPWFEVLDVSAASCINRQLTGCSWRPLPSPPLFPVLNEMGSYDSGPKIVEVESYAVVGNYILLSVGTDPFLERDAGTVAFDTYAEEWHYVDRERNLPFIGQAVPDGKHFLGRSRSYGNNITRYSVSVTKTNSSLMLSILEVPDTDAMANILPMIPGQFFSRLGNRVICSVRCCTQAWTDEEEIERDNICIDFYGPINARPRARKDALSSNPSNYFFRLKEPAYQLIAPTLVSALWMDVIKCL